MACNYKNNYIGSESGRTYTSLPLIITSKGHVDNYNFAVYSYNILTAMCLWHRSRSVSNMMPLCAPDDYCNHVDQLYY